MHIESIENWTAFVLPYLPLVTKVISGTHNIFNVKGISIAKNNSTLTNELMSCCLDESTLLCTDINRARRGNIIDEITTIGRRESSKARYAKL